MKKLLIKLLYKILGFKSTNVPTLIDGNDFIIKFNNNFYIMTDYTQEQSVDKGAKVTITFTDILSKLKKDKKRWDF